MVKTLDDLKKPENSDEDKPKRKRRKHRDIDKDIPIITPEAMSILSRSLLVLTSALLKYKLEATPEQVTMLNEGLSDCINAYVPVEDAQKWLPAVKAFSAVTTIAVYNYRLFKEQQLEFIGKQEKNIVDTNSGKEGLREVMSGKTFD